MAGDRVSGRVDLVRSGTEMYSLYKGRCGVENKAVLQKKELLTKQALDGILKMKKELWTLKKDHAIPLNMEFEKYLDNTIGEMLEK